MGTNYELRVGMSLYWARVTSEANGYTVTWTQHGRPMQVWSAGTKREALAEAREVARKLDASTAVS